MEAWSQSAAVALSPDGNFLAVARPDGQLAAYPLAGGNPRHLPALQPGEVPIQWSDDGRALFARSFQGSRSDVFRFDLEKGHRVFWRRLMSSALAAGAGINDVFLTPDGRNYCYGATGELDELHLIDGAL